MLGWPRTVSFLPSSLSPLLFAATLVHSPARSQLPRHESRSEGLDFDVTFIYPASSVPAKAGVTHRHFTIPTSKSDKSPCVPDTPLVGSPATGNSALVFSIIDDRLPHHPPRCAKAPPLRTSTDHPPAPKLRHSDHHHALPILHTRRPSAAVVLASATPAAHSVLGPTRYHLCRKGLHVRPRAGLHLGKVPTSSPQQTASSASTSPPQTRSPRASTRPARSLRDLPSALLVPAALLR